MREHRNRAGGAGRSEISEGILQEFLALCKIPHQTGHEQAISDYLCARLRELGYDAWQDESLNVITEIAPCEGLEHMPMIALQAHMDMVVAVSGKFDPEHDSVHAVVEGNILHTDGTSSLGADNGVGIAALLYTLGRSDLRHGPLKLIFTSGEEVGLRGARLLSSGVLEDVRYLINLDGFHSDRAIVGCMGGKREIFRHPITSHTVPEDCAGVRLDVSGLIGGHSGEDISLGRGNAIRLLAELLVTLWKKGYHMGIGRMDGGTGANVIPRSCTAYLAVRRSELGRFLRACETEFSHLTTALRKVEKHIRFEAGAFPAPKKVWTEQTIRDVLETIRDERDGVYAMSEQAEGCVGGSSNLGLIKTGEDTVEIYTMVRCENDRVEGELLHQHESTAAGHGFSVDVTGYRAWHQDADNPLTRAVQEVYMEIKNRPITVTIAPVGLEPAYFHEKAPWMRIVTLGVDIQDAHSTTERVKIDSMETLYRLIVGAVEKIQCALNDTNRQS